MAEEAVDDAVQHLKEEVIPKVNVEKILAIAVPLIFLVDSCVSHTRSIPTAPVVNNFTYYIGTVTVIAPSQAKRR